MTASIPVGVMYVVQPLQHSSATRRSSFTYAIDYTGTPLTAINNAQVATHANWDQNFDTQVTMLNSQGYYRTAPGGALQTIFSTSGVTVGTRAGSSQVSSVALRVTKRTAFVGRKWRGRIFLPWILTEADVDEVGNLLPTSLTSFQGHADDWLGALAAAPNIGSMQLLHSYTGAVDPELAATPVTSLSVQPTVGTQRRRISL